MISDKLSPLSKNVDSSSAARPLRDVSPAAVPEEDDDFVFVDESPSQAANGNLGTRGAEYNLTAPSPVSWYGATRAALASANALMRSAIASVRPNAPSQADEAEWLVLQPQPEHPIDTEQTTGPARTQSVGASANSADNIITAAENHLRDGRRGFLRGQINVVESWLHEAKQDLSGSLARSPAEVGATLQALEAFTRMPYEARLASARPPQGIWQLTEAAQDLARASSYPAGSQGKRLLILDENAPWGISARAFIDRLGAWSNHPVCTVNHTELVARVRAEQRSPVAILRELLTSHVAYGFSIGEEQRQTNGIIYLEDFDTALAANGMLSPSNDSGHELRNLLKTLSDANVSSALSVELAQDKHFPLDTRRVQLILGVQDELVLSGGVLAARSQILSNRPGLEPDQSAPLSLSNIATVPAANAISPGRSGNNENVEDRHRRDRTRVVVKALQQRLKVPESSEASVTRLSDEFKAEIAKSHPTVRETRPGTKLGNAVRTLEHIAKREPTWHWKGLSVKLKDLVALVYEGIKTLPVDQQAQNMDDLAILLDECVEDDGHIVCGNGCTQRVASVLQRALLPNLTSIEAHVPREFSNAMFKDFVDRELAGDLEKEPSSAQLEAFIKATLTTHRSQKFPEGETEDLERELKISARGFWPKVAASL